MLPESDPLQLMHRREAIKRVTTLLGGVALVGGGNLLAACAGDRAPRADSTLAKRDGFTPTDMAFLDEVAETILPETQQSPGAKAAKVGAFMALMVTDCYEPSDSQVFRTGMKQLDNACVAMHTKPFVSATPEQRRALLESLDREAKEYMDAKKDDQPAHYFRMIKELTLLGYFTSEIGYTKAMRYVESPGRFDPCVPYAKGEASWAGHA